MTIDEKTFQDDLRRIIREEVRPIIRDEVRPIIREEVRPIIREETADMRQDIAELKELKGMIGAQGMQLGALQADMTYLKGAIRHQANETHRLDVLLEDLNDRFAAARELRWD